MRPTILFLWEHDAVWTLEDRAEVHRAAQAIRAGLERAGYPVISLQIESPQVLPDALEPFDPRACIVFNWYEGTDWGAHNSIRVAVALSHLGYTYTGANPLTLMVTQDKALTKRVLTAYDIPTPVWQLLVGEGVNGWHHYPAIIKTATEHGSESLTTESVVADETDLRARVTALRAKGIRELMVAEFVEGREYTVSIWGNGGIEALPLVEIDYSGYPASVPRLRTFASKWDSASPDYANTRLICPPRISRELRDRITRVAEDTFRAFNLRDYGRIDIRLRGDAPRVIDVNSNPDLTAGSSFVIAAERAGYDYSAMLDHIVQLAARRAGTLE
jgi:D-alanine-D-alanine ligase